jgi:hypothetical protein
MFLVPLVLVIGDRGCSAKALSIRGGLGSRGVLHVQCLQVAQSSPAFVLLRFFGIRVFVALEPEAEPAFSPICAICRSQEEAQNLKMGPNVMRRLLCAPLLK